MTSYRWQRSIEQLALMNARHRMIGLTATRRGSGVSLMARLLAKTMAGGGHKVLLVDLSTVRPLTGHNDTTPVTAGALRSCVMSSDRHLDILSGNEIEEQWLSANLPRLNELMRYDLVEYQHIVLDLPPMLDDGADGFNKVAAAAMCDNVMLVCAIGHDKHSEIEEVSKMLAGAGVPLGGVISNEPPVKAVARERWRLPFPQFGKA